MSVALEFRPSKIVARDESGTPQGFNIGIERQSEGLYTFGLFNSSGWIKGSTITTTTGILFLLPSLPTGQSQWLPGNSEPVYSFVAYDFYLDVYAGDPTMFRCLRIPKSELHAAIINAVCADLPRGT